MANKFQLKRSAVQGKVPTTSDLDLGELGLNTHDGKIYMKKNDGTASIVEVGADTSNFLRSDVDDTFTQVITGNTLHLGGGQIQNSAASLQVNGFMRTGSINLHQGGSNPTATSRVLSNNAGSLEWNSNTVWHEGNDGSGSGLDADTVDGLEAASFLRSDANDTYTSGILTFGSGTFLNCASNDVLVSARRVSNADGGSDGLYLGTGNSNGMPTYVGYGGGSEMLKVDGSLTYDSNTVWHAGNDGSGSGLDADLLDGLEGSYYLDYNNLINKPGSVTKGDVDALNVDADTLDGQHGSYYLAYSNFTGTVPDADITDIGDSQARIITLDNLEKSNLSADGQLSFDSSQGLILYRTQQGTTGAVTVLDGANVDAGTGINITNLGLGDSGTGPITFSVDTSVIAPIDSPTFTGDLTIPNKIIHAGDTDTYFQFDAANKARIVCQGGEVMEWGNNYALMNDNDQFRVGTGSDFRIYFNGQDTFFRNYAHANGDIIFQGESSEGTNKNLLIMKTDGTRPYTIIYENSAERFRTTSAGVTITGALTATGDVTAFSDITLKKDIEVIPNALDKVSQIRGVTYERTDTEEPLRQAGVIAQEVEEVLPEVVHTNEDGIKSVAYGNLVSLLIESVKELKARVEELENN